MQNGNVNEFIDLMHYGDELIFMYDGKKYFLQGFKEDDICTLYLDCWEPPADDYIYVVSGAPGEGYPVEKFLEAKIWNGKSFWQAEPDMKWVDS